MFPNWFRGGERRGGRKRRVSTSLHATAGSFALSRRGEARAGGRGASGGRTKRRKPPPSPPRPKRGRGDHVDSSPGCSRGGGELRAREADEADDPRGAVRPPPSRDPESIASILSRLARSRRRPYLEASLSLRSIEVFPLFPSHRSCSLVLVLLSKTIFLH